MQARQKKKKEQEEEERTRRRRKTTKSRVSRAVGRRRWTLRGATPARPLFGMNADYAYEYCARGWVPREAPFQTLPLPFPLRMREQRPGPVASLKLLAPSRVLRYVLARAQARWARASGSGSGSWRTAPCSAEQEGRRGRIQRRDPSASRRRENARWMYVDTDSARGCCSWERSHDISGLAMSDALHFASD